MRAVLTRNVALRDTYNRIAEDWHAAHRTDTWWQETTDIFAGLVGADALVLDAGCGGGTGSRYLLGSGLQVVGIDFSEKLIAIARREVPEAAFHVCDVADAARLPEMFDGIFMKAVLLHIPKREAAGIVRKLVEKMTKGGYFYLTVKEIRPGQPAEEIKTASDYGYPYERFFSYYHVDEIENYMAQAGLTVCYERVALSGNTNWIQVIGQKQ